MATIPFPTKGVKVSFLDVFISRCGGREAIKDKTTAEIISEFVKPTTSVKRASYCEFQASLEDKCATDPDEIQYVDEATVFISHAWACIFLDVTSAIEHHFRDMPDTVIWFDLFTMNQNDAPNYDFIWLATTFKNAIQHFGNVVMVLAPWSCPIPFKRGWCLYEIYAAIATGSTFDVCMGAGEMDKLVNKMTTQTIIFTFLLNNIDVEKAECCNPDDLQKIKCVVETMVGGYDAVNTLVRAKMRSWFVGFIKSSLTTPGLTPLQAAQRLFAAGRYYEDSNDWEKVEEIYTQVLSLDPEVLEVYDATKDMNTLPTRNLFSGALCGLASVARERGKYLKECTMWYASMLPNTRKDRDSFSAHSAGGSPHLNKEFQYAARSRVVGGGVDGGEKDKVQCAELVDWYPSSYETYPYGELAKAHEKEGCLEEALACYTLVYRYLCAERVEYPYNNEPTRVHIERTETAIASAASAAL